MSQAYGGGGFQVLQLDAAISEDEIDKDILYILAHLSRIVHDKPRFVNHAHTEWNGHQRIIFSA